jgi:hypothetical protein
MKARRRLHPLAMYREALRKAKAISPTQVLMYVRVVSKTNFSTHLAFIHENF